MNQENESEKIRVIVSLLADAGLIAPNPGGDCPGDLRIQPLSGDGSTRRFWRIRRQDGASLALAVAPAERTETEMKEARAARKIGLHLHGCGARVPAQYGWDAEQGLLLFDDLGDLKLHDLVGQARAAGPESAEAESLRLMYIQVMEQLALMQVRGAQGFDPDWCWDTPRYDRQVMLERESGYFLRACWQDLLGQSAPVGIQEEFAQIAGEAAQADAAFFLHRDCQSRNIMVRDGQICFIDFQGGRLGPLGYDPASLLVDPYAALPLEFQEELLGVYLAALQTLHPVDEKRFRREYAFLALQRNLQIIGAFSFLSRARGKVFFASFILPALETLVMGLHASECRNLPLLRQTAERALRLVREQR